MANCVEHFHLEGNKVLSKIGKDFGTDFDGFKKFILGAFSDFDDKGNFVLKDDVARLFQETYGRPINFSSKTPRQEATKLYNIVNQQILDPSRTARDRNTRKSNYANEADRSYIQNRIVARDILRLYSMVRFNAKNAGKQPNNKRQWYINHVRWAYDNKLAARVKLDGDARSNQDIIAEARQYQGGWLKYFYNKLGGNEITPQDLNLLATVAEMHQNPSYFDEVFYNGELGVIKKERTEDVDHQDDDVVGFGVSDIDGKDEYRNWSDEVSESSVDLVDEDLRTFFNTLRKVRSPKKPDGQHWDYDKSSPIGEADYLDASEVSTTLYHRLRGVNSVDEMINIIDDIAKNEDGKASFALIADQMRADNDFKQLMFKTFAKDLFYKNSTYLNDDTAKAQVVNSGVNTRDALASTMFGMVRYTVLNTNHEFNETKFINAWNLLKANKEAVKLLFTKDADDLAFSSGQYNIQTVKDALNDFSNVVRAYYPNITDGAIERFVKSGEDAFANLANFAEDIRKTITSARASKRNYEGTMLSLTRQRQINRDLVKQFGTKAKDQPGYYDIAEYQRQLRERDYLDENQNNIVVSIANKFDKFILGDVTNDSSNAEGKRASDVADSSRITFLRKVLNDDVAIKNFGEIREKVAGTRYSNFLLETRDADGNIVNYGLFRETADGQFTPTEYAKDLMIPQRFDGVSNRNNGDAAVYSRMVQADYVTAAYINFFNPAVTVFQGSSANPFAAAGGQYGMYFMRTPSDAPKNFNMVMARYRYHDIRKGDLFTISNQAEINKAIGDRLNDKSEGEMKYTDQSMIGKVAFQPNAGLDSFITRERAAAIIFDGNNKAIKITSDFVRQQLDSERVKPENGRVKVQLYVGKDKKDQIIVSGKYNHNSGTLSDIKYEGVKYGFDEGFRDWYFDREFKAAIERGEAVRTVNHNHPIFQQYKRAYLQELADAAEALGKFFELNDDGSVALDFTEDGKAIPRIKAGIDINDPNSNKGYETYHFKLDSKKHRSQFWKDSSDDSEPFDKVTLIGTVFHSNKFKLFTKPDGESREREVNYAEEGDMTTAINLLYGGVDDSFIHAKRDVNNHVLSIELTEAQEKAVDAMLDKYLSDMTNQAFETFKGYDKFIGDLSTAEVSFENVAEFMTNYNLAYYTFDELYEGSSKFYGSAQDFLKRAKEAQAGGDPYGTADYRQEFDSQRIQVELPNAKFTAVSVDGKKTSYEIKSQNKFRAVTIYNSVRTDDANIERIAQLMSKSSGTDINKAREIIRKNYEDLKTNDAQSYITFDEWVRRIAARGQFNKYRPLIEAILDESKPIDVKALGQFVQVQKNFYYDLYFDPDMGIIVPRQIKNAEFVLIPRFIKGTELEQVYNVMKDNGIDQLNTRETTKAGKKDVLTLWDENGELTQENLDNFRYNVQAAAEDYSYNNLYTQQETVQHTNTDNKISVQIVKKIVDNIPPTSRLAPVKDDFFKTYVEKIHRSFIKLCNELKIPTDSNGNLQLDSNGDIAGVDYDNLFIRLRQEATRNGMDSNLLDYFTMKDKQITGVLSTKVFNAVNTYMPLYMSNMSAKTQSVVNAVFNASITRQKINGFHAAQVTNVGFRYTKQNIKSSNILKYHADADLDNPDESKRHTGTMEIMMTYSAFGVDVNSSHYKALRKKAHDKAVEENSTAIDKFNQKYKVSRSKQNQQEEVDKNTEIERRTKELFDQYIIEELAAEGLDKVVAYRIPTEGKQSMTVAKIAHFLDDTQGSTIVVPDEWVAQTGSDFDIDSVYGIQHKSYTDKVTGQVHKIKYKAKDFDDNDYNSYVRRNVNIDKSETDISVQIEAEKEARDAYKKLYSKLQNATAEVYEALPKNFKRLVQQIDTGITNAVKANPNLYGGSKRDEFIDRLKNKLNMVEQLKPQLEARGGDNQEFIKLLDDFYDAHAELLNYISGNDERAPQGKLGDAIKALVEERNQVYDKYASANGLLTREQFKARSGYENNSDQALNNNMVDDMIRILQDPSQAEENLSSSTFVNITDAVKKVQSKGNSSIIAEERKSRSPYNFLDQANYMNDVMSGARLKAFSVTRDTFCSVCNTVRPTLGEDYHIKIKYEDGREIEHDKYGWSDDNKNVDGFILTAYSSQTSAHAFDAVKNGSVPNVNDYTFAAYKLFPEIGSNYDCAVSFIMQPGIRRIVDAYNSNKSVFLEGNTNPIHEAIRSIAGELGIKDADKNPIDDVIEELNKTYLKEFQTISGGTFKSVKKISLDENDVKDVVFDVTKQLNRCWYQEKEGGDTEIRRRQLLLYDLGTILQFNRLNSIAQKITDLARVSNPDKFGAKQTIFSTNKVYDDIHDLIDSDANKVLRVPYTDTERAHATGDTESLALTDTMPFLEAIYPGIYGTLDEYLTGKSDHYHGLESRYPTLNTFLRYATGTSLKVARPLFRTQNENFRRFIYGLDYAFDRTRPVKIDEQTYNDFERYTLGQFYRAVDMLSAPTLCMMIESEGRFTHFKVKDNVSDADRLDELDRINGYTASSTIEVERNGERVPFEVKNVNNPTIQEITEFNTLTPAQKIAWIKQHGDNGIFSRLEVGLNNNYRGSNRTGRQTIRLKENSANDETLYSEFNEAINNENPLIASAALDIVKYAFLVEGFKPQTRGITKIIKNTALYRDKLFGDASDTIIGAIDGQFNNVFSPNTPEAHAMYEEYVRSHPNMRQLPHTYIRRIGKKRQFIEIPSDGDGLLHIDSSDKAKLKTYHIATFDNKGAINGYNQYVVLSNRGEKTIYKIVTKLDPKYAEGKDKALNDRIYLVPLNQLDSNEHGDWSANPDNNKNFAQEFYMEKIRNLEASKLGVEKLNINSEDYKYKPRVRVGGEKAYDDFDLYKPSTDARTSTEGEFASIIKRTNDFFSKGENVDKVLYLPTITVGRKFHKVGLEYGKQQRIVDNNGVPYVVDMFKPGLWGYAQQVLSGKVHADDAHIPSGFREILKYYKENGLGDVSNIVAISLHRDMDSDIKKELDEKKTKLSEESNETQVENDMAESAISDVMSEAAIEDGASSPVEENGANESSARGASAETPVRRVRDEIFDSTVRALYNEVRRAAIHNDEEAQRIMNRFNRKGISGYRGNLNIYSNDVINGVYRYTVDRIGAIQRDLRAFATRDGQFVSITDPYVIDKIKTDVDFRNKFLNLILEAKALVDDRHLGIIKHLDITSQDKQLQDQLTAIKDMVDGLEKNQIIDKAFKLFGNEYLDKISTNPLIQDELLSVLDGYHGTGFIEAYISDLQDSANPMVQIVTKEVMADVRAAELKGREVAINFFNTAKSIMKDAQSKGQSCSWDDIIDTYGRLRQRYTQQYIDDYFKLNDELTDAKARFGEYSIEAIKAGLNRRKWLADNTEQAINMTQETDYEAAIEEWNAANKVIHDFTLEEYIDNWYHKSVGKNAKVKKSAAITARLTQSYKEFERIAKMDKEDYAKEYKADLPFGDDEGGYYHAMNELEERIINSSPEVYQQYVQYNAELQSLIDKRTDILDDNLEKDIQEKRRQIKALTKSYKYDPETGEYADKSGKELQDADNLREYILNKRKLQHQVFENETREGWQEELEKNLAVLDKYERYDSNGNLMSDRSDLAAKHSDYADALKWLNQHAQRDVDSDLNNPINQEYQAIRNTIAAQMRFDKITDPVERALQEPIQHKNKDGSYSYPRTIRDELREAYKAIRGDKKERYWYKAILDKYPKGARNQFGEIDATMLSDEDLRIIKERQEYEYGGRLEGSLSDKRLLNNAGRNPAVYTQAFYKGLTVGGYENKEYGEAVREFNKFAMPFWDEHTGVLHTSEMSIEQLNEMRRLLDKLDTTRRKIGATQEDVAAAAKFRQENVTEKYNEDIFNAEADAAEAKGKEYYRAWLNANMDFDVHGTGVGHPASRLYGYLTPKDEVMSKYLDKTKTRAFKIIQDSTETVKTSAWRNKYRQMREANRHDEEQHHKAGDVTYKSSIFSDWYEANTVWNPNTHTREPLRCWVTSRVRNDYGGDWIPKGADVRRTIKKVYQNKRWHKGNQGKMIGVNYKQNDNASRYNAHLELNDSQQKLYNHVYKMLNTLVKEDRARDYIRNGQLPTEMQKQEAESKATALKKLGKAASDFIGWSGVPPVEDNQPAFDLDAAMYQMPMMRLLQKNDIEHKELVYPERRDYTSDEEYRKAQLKYHKEKRERDAQALEEHKELMSRDWDNIFQRFIAQAYRYNSIADNKAMLLYVQKWLEGKNVYSRNEVTGKFKYDPTTSTEGNPQYVKQQDKRLAQWYDNWCKRLVMDIWKEPTSQRINRFASRFQNLTSSMYMMLNVRGGISNITTGLTNIAAEAFARDYFDWGDWQTGLRLYNAALPDYLKNMFNPDAADTLQGALIKVLNVVDFDELNGQVKLKDEKSAMDTLRNLMFSTNSAGEHFMQNTAMLTMMQSHRLIRTSEIDAEGEKNGKPKYVLMNEMEYLRSSEEQAFRRFIGNDSRRLIEYNTFKEKIRMNPEKFRKYAQFQDNLQTMFMMINFTPAEIAEYTKIRKQVQAENKKKFEDDVNHPKLYSQFELGTDGRAHFKEGSIMDELHGTVSEGQHVDDALRLMGGFKQRVISVNKKIHGYYDKMSRAQIENQWWGGLVMQYHKHIYMGMAKAWRRQGFYNEERGTVEKGRYMSLFDFLRLPIKAMKLKAGMTDNQVDTMTGIQNVLGDITNYCINLKSAWGVLPQYERNNIRRTLGFMTSIMGAFFTALALRLMMDDDNKDSIMLNLALYEADRLMSESRQTNPFGIPSEFKTLWSQPVAATSIVDDLLSSGSELAKMIMQGDDYEGEYSSGQYAGMNKLQVHVLRRTPIVRQVQSMELLPNNNKAYKIGNNALFGVISPNSVSKAIKGED